MLRIEILVTLGSWFEKAETNHQLMARLLPPALETWPISAK